MPLLTDSIKNDLATAYGTQAAYAELATTAPGSAAGTAASTTARSAITWTAAGAVGPLGAGSQPATPGKRYGQAVFAVLADVTVAGINYFTALTGGVYKDGASLGTPRVLKNGDSYTINITYTQA